MCHQSKILCYLFLVTFKQTSDILLSGLLGHIIQSLEKMIANQIAHLDMIVTECTYTSYQPETYLERLYKCPQQYADGIALPQQFDETCSSEET